MTCKRLRVARARGEAKGAARAAGAAEVIGGFLMLPIALGVFLMGFAMLDQARRTADSIRGLAPGGEERGPRGPEAGPSLRASR